MNTDSTVATLQTAANRRKRAQTAADNFKGFYLFFKKRYNYNILKNNNIKKGCEGLQGLYVKYRYNH